MQKYVFWNNKGGTGKTSLAFQTICQYAHEHSDQKVLAIDMCPQANLSELLLGGLEGNGSNTLIKLQSESNRRTIGGYFQFRMPSPYKPQYFNAADYITKASTYNVFVPHNIDVVCGDPLLELQSNAVSTLANTQIPGTDTWISIIDWLNDFIEQLESEYDILFVDTNPSFSIYTQMAIASADRLILPVMADDSSKRAIQNAFSLIYGFKLPHPLYAQYAFSTKLKAASRSLPKVHLIVKNRLTQYMGAASAYYAVLKTINRIVDELSNQEDLFTKKDHDALFVDVRDFQTTGVVSFARGCPFFELQSRNYSIQGKRIQIKDEYRENCISAIKSIVEKL